MVVGGKNDKTSFQSVSVPFFRPVEIRATTPRPTHGLKDADPLGLALRS